MEHVDRAIEAHVGGFLLRTFAAVMVTGPRAVGKTTSMRALSRTNLDLSVPAVRSAVAADPDAALVGLDPPVLIDEWQEVPDVVGAVKRLVDRDPMPGQVVMTGSVRGPLEGRLWGGTGRLIRVRMFGLSQAEIEGTEANPIDTAFGDPGALAAIGMAELNRNDYIDRVVSGGFPTSFRLDSRARATWFRSYVTQLIERDAQVLAGIRMPSKLQSVLTVCAARSAQEQKIESMCKEAGVAKTTLYAHLDILENLQVLWRLPAWTPSPLKRLVRLPKIHLTDTGMTAAVLGANSAALRVDGNLSGPLFESFVAGELLKAAQTAQTSVELFHLRAHDGGEVDVVAVADDGRVIGVEVKAASTTAPGDARGLRWLRDRLGPKFVGGYVVHTGPLSQPMGDRLWAIPCASLWRASPTGPKAVHGRW